MFRLVGVALLLALSGCLASPPATLPLPVVEDDGVSVTATRVEPLVHAVDAAGRIESRLCDPLAPECPGPGAFDWPRPTFDFADPLALFWRVNVNVEWRSLAPQEGLQLTAYATRPCGIDCVRERKVVAAEEVEAPHLHDLDIYLNPGETGVRLRIEPVGAMETAWGDAGIEYRLHGVVGGYRAVAAPVVIG